VSFVAVQENIRPTSGMKRNIGYAYHHEGELQRAEEVFQVAVPETFEGPEVHYFRQDVDQHLAGIAVRYGATLREGVRIEDVHIDEQGVRLDLEGGERTLARYVVDGYRSVLSNKLDLRESPSRFRTQSRSIFTHMTGVLPYEECPSAKAELVPQRFSQGTLHHCFDGGWLWVIPFNNGPSQENPLVSIGLQLDNRKNPYEGRSPEEEWSAFLARFPSIAEQFREAKLARPWVSTGERMQYSSKRTVGDRFCLTAHAAGSLGPLFSRGLVLTMRAMFPLAERLLAGIEDGDFSASRFALVDELQQRTLDNVDVIVAGMYTSWRSFELFDAWVRFWYATGVLGFFQIEAAYSYFLRTQDRDALRRMLHGKNVGSLCSAFEAFQPFFAGAIAAIQSVDAGELTEKAAAARIMELLKGADFLPPGFHFTDLEKRHGGPFDVEHWRQILTWGNHEAPKAVKDSLYPGDPTENVARFMARVEASLQSPRLDPIRAFIASSNGASTAT
jgi:FADH2 O2-dependent halogenase